MFLYHLVWVVQMVSHTEEPETPVASSSPQKLDVSAIIWCWRPGWFLESYWSLAYAKRLKKVILIPVKKRGRDRMDEVASSCDSKQTRSNVSFFHVLLSGLLPEGTPTFRAGVPASNNQTKEVPHRNAHWFTFYFISDLIKLTTKFSHCIQQPRLGWSNFFVLPLPPVCRLNRKRYPNYIQQGNNGTCSHEGLSHKQKMTLY